MKRRRTSSLISIAGAFVVLAMLGRVSFGAIGDIVGFAPCAGLAAAAMGLRWEARRRVAVVVGVLGAMVAVAFGTPVVSSLVFGLGVATESLVAIWLLRRRVDPVARPETARWWGDWAVAAAVGSLTGATLFSFVAGPVAGMSIWPVLASWVTGHVGGMLLVAPGIWAAARWQRTGGWRHKTDIHQLAIALTAVIASSAVGAGLALLTDRTEPFVLPVLVLGWLALTMGHRVTVMASSAGATAILLAVPWWTQVHPVSPVSATVAIVLGHAAASGLAIESSSRWHARALLAGVVEIATEAVLIVDADGRVMVGNPAAKRLFGDPLEGGVVTELLPGLGPDWTSNGLTGGMMDGRGASGRRTSVEVVVGPVDAPGRPMFAMVCRDMTDVKAAAAALRRSAEIIDATPDLVGWTDRDGSLLFLNKAGRAMMEATDDEVIDSWTAAGLLTRDAIDAAGRDGIWQGETELLLRNGIRLPVAQTVIAHRSDEGAIRFFSIVARDISERYELETMKDEFVANVTHELRSPLTAVIGYLQLLQSGAFGELSADVSDVLTDVSTSSNQLLELINDLLDLWRAEGRVPAEMVDLDLGEVVEAAARTIRPVAAGKRITLSIETEALITVGDRRQLERAFLNVVSNAVKFTPIGGRVAVSVAAVDGRAEVRVTDTGVGIPTGELDSVFERFYRASTAEEAEIPGTGLGLPLVREVMRAHGGEALIESVVGEGTTVVIHLPILVRTAPLSPVR